MDAVLESPGDGLRKRPVASDDQDGQKSKIASPSEKEAYFNMLRLWVNQTMLQQSVNQCFPYYLMAQNASTFVPAANQSQQPLRTPGDEILGANGGGYEYNIAPIWKRVVAEAIDVAILFLIKLLLTFAVVDILNIDLGTALDLNTLKTSLEDDYTQLFNMASELIVLELFTKVFTCVYETFWTMRGQGGSLGGATPGKLVMGIRILYVETVIVVDQDQQQVPPQVEPVQNMFNFRNNPRVKALLYPARDPGWKRAFFRAFIKSATVIIPVVYPVYLFTFMFRNHRMGYDIMTKTIVVEENPAPVLRRL